MAWIWDSKGRPERSEGNKQSGGLFVRPWENPSGSERSPPGLWAELLFALKI